MNDKNHTPNNPSAPLPPIFRKRRFKTILLGIFILFFGMIIGAGAVFIAGHKILINAMHPGEKMSAHIAQRINWKLDLTDSQEIQVRKIINLRVAAFRGILENAYPGIIEQFELLRTEVAQVLTEEQKIEWETHYGKIFKQIQRHVPPPPLPAHAFPESPARPQDFGNK